MPENRQLPTASIPSKLRARSAHRDVHGSLIVTKLDGGASLDDSDVTSVLNDVILPNGEALSRMNSSRLKKEIKFKINNMEYDPHSLDLLVRLLKSGPLANDVINDENKKPEPVPISSNECDVTKVEALDEEFTSSRMFLISSPNSNASPRMRSTVVTSDPSTRFRKSIEALKNAREKFGVSMAVNGNIAKSRTIHRQNLKNRKEGREKLPMLTCQSNCELSRDKKCESAREKNSPQIPYRRSWLTLSGRQIQLKHQGHVERVLGHPEPKNDETPTIKKKRNAKSAPLREASNLVPLQRFAWSEGNKFVIQKVTKTFRSTKSPINLPDAHGFHGYHSFSPTLELRSAEIHATPTISEEIPEKSNIKKNVSIDVAKELPKPSPLRATEEIEQSSRPSSGTMPRPVRSVIIKLPKSDTMTPPATVMTPSRPVMSQRAANSFPPKPTVKFGLRQKT